LLGAIGSGKSSVAGEFARLGCGVVDADVIVHGLLKNDDNIRSQIRAAFGEKVFGDDGLVDREALGEIVFASDKTVSLINEIVHPAVFAIAGEQIDGFENEDDIKAIVLDMPLLAEVGWEKKCDKLVFVACDERIRGERAAKKSGFYKKQLKNREKFQISLDKKTQIADYVVSNNSDLSVIKNQVARVFSNIIEG